MLAQDTEQQKPAGMESHGSWVLEMGLLFLSPTVMLLAEASDTRQFCFPTLYAQPGGKHEATPTGFPNLSEDFILLNNSSATPVNSCPREIKLSLICQIFLRSF